MGKLSVRPRYGRVAVATGAVAAASAGFLVLAGPASAHAAPITGSAACAANGTYTVTYQVHVSTVTHNPLAWTFALYTTAPTGSTVQAFSPNGVGDSTLTLTQVNVPAVPSTARVIGEVTWADHVTSGAQTGTVPISGTCAVITPPTVTTSASTPVAATTTATAPTSVTTTAPAPITTSATATAPTTAATTPGLTSSAVNAPPPLTSSAATTAPVSAINNAPPPPTTSALEATSASKTTSAVAVDAPLPSATPSTAAVNSPTLAATGPNQPVGRTIGLAMLLGSLGALLLGLTRRRQHS